MRQSSARGEPPNVGDRQDTSTPWAPLLPPAVALTISPVARIARRYCISRQSVYNVVNGVSGAARERVPRPSLLDPFKPHLRARLARFGLPTMTRGSNGFSRRSSEWSATWLLCLCAGTRRTA